MADDGRVNFFTAEAEARAMRKLGFPVWTTSHARIGDVLQLCVIACPGGSVRSLVVDVPNRIYPCDATDEYDAFIGKIACLL